jgi:hypothetical protein
MADCTLFLVKIFRKPSKVRKSCKGSSYITVKVLSNKTKLIFIVTSLYNAVLYPHIQNSPDLHNLFSRFSVQITSFKKKLIDSRYMAAIV